MADLRGFILVECFIGYDFVRMCLIAPGTGVRGPGLMRGDSNLIFAIDCGTGGKSSSVLCSCKGKSSPTGYLWDKERTSPARIKEIVLQ